VQLRHRQHRRQRHLPARPRWALSAAAL
jgi:hypothetical protein